MINTQVTLVATLLTAAALGGAASQDAERHVAPPQTTSTENPLVTAPAKKPFTNIFVSPRARLNSPQPADRIVEVEIQPRPRVVCGMILVPGNPGIDPKLIVRPRLSTPTADYKIRAMIPTVCGG